MLKRAYIFIIFILLVFPGCQKDELALPTEVEFVFEMTEFEVEEETETEFEAEVENEGEEKQEEERDNTPDAQTEQEQNQPPFDDNDNPGNDENEPDNTDSFQSLTIERAQMVITAIEIEGIREQGKDVFMVSEFEPAMEIDLNAGETSGQTVSFDLPQGIYKKLDVLFYLGTTDKPGISFKGTAKQGKSGVVNLLFDYNLTDNIAVRAMKDSPAAPIVLDKSKDATARVIVDTGYLFRTLTMNKLAETKIISTPNGKQINIDRSNNEAVFNNLEVRLGKAISIVFEE